VMRFLSERGHIEIKHRSYIKRNPCSRYKVLPMFRLTHGKKSSGKPEPVFLLLYYARSNSVKKRSLDEKEDAG